MGFYEKENNGFTILYCYVSEHPNDTYTFIYDDRKIMVTFDCMYETDNGLDIGEDGYEEFNAIAFLDLAINELFEVNYSNLPKAIMCGDLRIL